MIDDTQALTIFTSQFEENKVRVVMHHGEPWFVASDICDALGIANHRQAVSVLPDHQKDDVRISDSIGRIQLTKIVSEGGVYRLTFRSNKPKAEAFTDHVTEVILPSIRKTGSYSIHQQPFSLNGRKTYLERLDDLQADQTRFQKALDRLDTIIARELCTHPRRPTEKRLREIEKILDTFDHVSQCVEFEIIKQRGDLLTHAFQLLQEYDVLRALPPAR